MENPDDVIAVSINPFNTVPLVFNVPVMGSYLRSISSLSPASSEDNLSTCIPMCSRCLGIVAIIAVLVSVSKAVALSASLNNVFSTCVVVGANPSRKLSPIIRWMILPSHSQSFALLSKSRLTCPTESCMACSTRLRNCLYSSFSN